MRFRVTVRSDVVELRGYCDDSDVLVKMADLLNGTALVIASPASPDYDPFVSVE